LPIKGTIKESESRLVLDGYRKFDAKLSKK
jgi:hypothetical protein